MGEPTDWDLFENHVKSLLLRWREIADAHPGHELRFIGACVSGINGEVLKNGWRNICGRCGGTFKAESSARIECEQCLNKKD